MKLSILVLVLCFVMPSFAEDIYLHGFNHPNKSLTVVPILGGFLVGGAKDGVPSLTFLDGAGKPEWQRTYQNLDKGWISFVHPLSTPGTFLVFGESGTNFFNRYVWSMVVDDKGAPSRVRNYTDFWKQSTYSMTLHAVHPSADGKFFWISGTSTTHYKGKVSASLFKVDEKGKILYSADYGAQGGAYVSIAAKDDGAYLYSIVTGIGVDPKVANHIEEQPLRRNISLMVENLQTKTVQATRLSEDRSARIIHALPRAGGWDLLLEYVNKKYELVKKLVRIDEEGNRKNWVTINASSEENDSIVSSMFRGKNDAVVISGYFKKGRAWAYKVDRDYSRLFEREYALGGSMSFVGAGLRDDGTVFAKSNATGEVELIEVNKEGAKN